MSSKMLLEIHILQNFAPSCLNRDELNFPKEAVFGGVKRARISSQCLKRATRMNEEFRNAAGLSFGLRTRKLHKQVEEELRARNLPEADIQRASADVLTLLHAIFKRHADGSQTQAAQFADAEEIQKLADLALVLPEKMKDLKASLSSEQREAAENAEGSLEEMKEEEKRLTEDLKGFRAQLKDKTLGEEIRKETQSQETEAKVALADIKNAIKAAEERAKKLSPLRAEVEKIFGRGKESGTVTVKAVDIALFGRMIAEIENGDVDAASQVAHAISTHESGTEEDFWSMVDDLNKPGQDRGAGLINSQNFNSATFYRYANVHLAQLARNLGGDAELARSTALAFTRAFITAIPTAKQNSHAAHNPPDLVLVVVREKGQPLSLANAFAKPIPAGGRAPDVVGGSIRGLASYWNRLLKAYGKEGVVGVPYFTIPEGADAITFDEGLRVGGMDALLKAASEALKKFTPEAKGPRA